MTHGVLELVIPYRIAFMVEFSNIWHVDKLDQTICYISDLITFRSGYLENEDRFCINLLLIIWTLQDKEEKERQMNSRAAVEETAEDRALNSIGLEEEIIELQDLRMSPIPSLRNRHKAKYYKEPGGRLHGMCPNLLHF